MAGIAQVWLTEKELDALLAAAPSMGKRVNEELWATLGDKLLSAYRGVACKPAVSLHTDPEAQRRLEELARVSPSKHAPESEIRAVELEVE